ncbi:MAG: hypothetical protein P8Z37_09895 [Acidobacteriota bacterium]
MTNSSNGNNFQRRDFIKVSALAGMAAVIPQVGRAAQSPAGGSKPSPAGVKRTVTVVSDTPENYEKLMASIRSMKEFEFQTSFVKADFRKPEDVANVLKETATDVFVIGLPGIGVTSGRFADNVGSLQTPIILIPPILELIMLEADVVARLQGKGVNAMLANSESKVLDLIRVVSRPRILEGKKALIFGKPFDSSSVPAPELDVDYIYQHTGVRLEYRPISDLLPLLQAVDEDKAKEEMQRWKQDALNIVEPTDEAILKASRMYVLLRSIIDKENLSAISIDCLSFSFDAEPILPLPCLGYTRLRDEGVAAPCEADVCMLLSSMFLQEISQKPSFFHNVSEVNIEQSYTVLRHCVAPTKLLGADKAPLPFNLRDYHGFGRDIVPEVDFPVGEEITMGGFSKDLNSFLLWPGRIQPGVMDTDTPSFANVPEDAPATMKNMRRFCSNRAQVKIRDAEMFLGNIAGIHQVMVAGSYSKTIYDAARRMNVQVIAPPDLTPPSV